MKIKSLTIFFFIFVCASSAFAQNGEAVKIEELGAAINCEDYLARMDNILSQAQNDPNSQIYVFVYEGKTQRYKYKKDGSSNGTETLLPQLGLAKARIRSMRQYVSQVRKFDIGRFVFVEAGLRENASVEIWNVPAGATAPSPAPTLKKIRYRKGKPAGFCLGCC